MQIRTKIGTMVASWILTQFNSAFAFGESNKDYIAVIGLVSVGGTLEDVRLRFKKASGFFCDDFQGSPGEATGSGTSGYADYSFANPNTFLCSYKATVLQAIVVCAEKSICDAVPVSIVFGEASGIPYEELPSTTIIADRSTDPFSMLQAYLSDEIKPSDRHAYQFTLEVK